jgi:hypothetical protein
LPFLTSQPEQQLDVAIPIAERPSSSCGKWDCKAFGHGVGSIVGGCSQFGLKSKNTEKPETRAVDCGGRLGGRQTGRSPLYVGQALIPALLATGYAIRIYRPSRRSH